MTDPSDDVFDRLRGNDGFHVVEIDTGIALSLYAQVYGGGELYNLVDPQNPDASTVLVRTWSGPSEADRGECSRLRYALQAVARYLKLGGTWDELTEGMRVMSRVVVGGLAFPGYHLHESYPTYDPDLPTDFVYQHVFVRDEARPDQDPDDRDAVLWTDPTYTDAGDAQGGFIERKTLRQIRKEQEDDEERGRREGGAGAGDDDRHGGHPVPLLGIEDL